MKNELTDKQAHSFCLEAIKLREVLESGFLSLGEKLMKIRNSRLWESNWESFELYLEDAKITPATASRLITVYSTFIVDYQMDEAKIGSIGWSALYDIATKTENKTEAKEFVDKAMVMRRSDLVEELKGRKKNECKTHDLITIEICKNCGFKQRIYK